MSDRRFYAHALEKIIYRNSDLEIVAAVQVTDQSDHYKC